MFEFGQQNVAVGERRTKGSFAVLVETCKINKWRGLATASESGTIPVTIALLRKSYPALLRCQLMT